MQFSKFCEAVEQSKTQDFCRGKEFKFVRGKVRLLLAEEYLWRCIFEENEGMNSLDKTNECMETAEVKVRSSQMCDARLLIYDVFCYTNEVT